MTDLRLLDLFSGIGGFSYAAERLVGGYETVGFCEIDPFCRQVLNKHWPDVEVFEDVRRTDDFVRCGRVDIITGGYPCQPFSLAGKQKGVEDDRHLWPAMFELIKQKRPAFVVGENVAGHITLGLDQVLSDLEGEGYTARPFVIPACAVDAPHRRDRVWVVAEHVGHSNSSDSSRDEPASVTGRRQPGLEARREAVPDSDSARQCASQGCGQDGRDEAGHDTGRLCSDVADATRKRMEGHRPAGEQEPQSPTGERLPGRDRAREEPSFWLPEPGVGRVAHGVSRRVDRLKSLGNSIVPQVAAQILRAIREAHDA
jgi:DNA (cytosine-5)-methyltransferase 1